MSGITTHVLDTSTGRPAAGVPIRLERLQDDAWVVQGTGLTDDDGRLRDLLDGPAEAGTWRIHFDTGVYFTASRREGFYPYVDVVFTVEEGEAHYHVPLLLNPYGYSTYRGS
jgi:5-hydroxyisourate hydrolase